MRTLGASSSPFRTASGHSRDFAVLDKCVVRAAKVSAQWRATPCRSAVDRVRQEPEFFW